MDKWQAIHQFWSSFGLPAYDETAVPDDAKMPYITYGAAVSNFEKPITLTADIWDRSMSWERASHIADEIASTLGGHMHTVSIGGHQYMALDKASTFAQRVRDEDETVRRVRIMLQAEFYTFS